MSASQILLAGHGPEDQWLSDNPNRTYFEAKYQPRVNRSRETYEIPFDNQVTFDSTGRCTIPVKGDYMTRLTLRAVMPPIYPTVPGQYVYPTPSSQVDGTVYVNMGLTQVVADGTTLTANTTGSHYFSVGAAVTLSGTAYSIFDLDGTYTISTIPTANSFTCSTTLAGISYNGTASILGFIPSDVVGYFSTSNFDLWGYNLTNKTWSITNVDIVGNQLTITTSTPSGFSAGQRVHILVSSLGLDEVFTVVSATDTTLTVNRDVITFVAVGEMTLNKSMYSNDDGQTWVTSDTPNTSFLSVAYGNGTFVAVGITSIYSTDNGQSWVTPPVTPFGNWRGVVYGNGTFVAVGQNVSMYSIDDGRTWVTPAVTPSGDWRGVVYGNGTFVAVGQNVSMYSIDKGKTWVTPAVTPSGTWSSIAYGNGTFVAVSFDGKSMYSNNDGQTWVTPAVTPPIEWHSVAYRNGTFVAIGTDKSMYSTDDGQTWVTPAVTPSGYWTSVTYGNGTFVAVGGGSQSMYSTDDGQSWVTPPVTPFGTWYSVTSSDSVYVPDISDILYLETPPLVITTTQTQFDFSSSVYPSISFATSLDAAFWGFDSRNGLTYSFPINTPWTLTQGGWVPGFLPASLSTWDDSVAHKLCKAVRILLGKQTIKEYTGEYIELQNDLMVSYENKAILKLMNGTLDQTQAIVSREYYTTLPIGTKEIPLCALTQQQMSVEIDFEKYANLSQNLNHGTGDFIDPDSYLTYDASNGILGGQPVNVQTTFSYQQYIFIVTYGGQFIVYDTTKDIADPASYITLSAFSGTSLFSQFCVLSSTLYIGLSDGTLASIIISELIQGNISSFATNNYTPTIGSLTGTIATDFRYVYYTVSNTATSNVFFSRYDTTKSFTNPGSYTTFNFTSNIDSTTTSIYQLISTGSRLIAITNTPGRFYTFNLNGNFTTSWNSVDYSAIAYQITSGVLIGTTVYFVADSCNIIKYTNDTFTSYDQLNIKFLAVGGESMYSPDNGHMWVTSNTPIFCTSVAYGNGTFVAVIQNASMYSTDNGQSWVTPPITPLGNWRGVAYGNGTFVAVSFDGKSMYSNNDGQTWVTPAVTPPNDWYSVAYGNGTFVAVSYYDGKSMYSTDDGQTWVTPAVTPSGTWRSIAYGNGTFVAVSTGGESMYSTDDGQTWITPAVTPSYPWGGIGYGNGTFVAVSLGGQSMYSNDDGQSWTVSTSTPSGEWRSVAYGNGTFVAVGPNASMYSGDKGNSWLTPLVSPSGVWYSVTCSTETILPDIESGITNLLAVGTMIYASSNAIVFQIDTTQDLASPLAYKYYSSTTPNSPNIFDGTAPKIFANGPRYVYMFTQDASQTTTPMNIVRYDPYPPDSAFKASILVDYESLPNGINKPDRALIGLVQTQKVTDMTHMDIKGPVKELWVTGVSATTNVFQYSNLATRSTLSLAGEKIVTDDDGTHTFLNVIEPFETHTSMPIRNVSVVSFEFDPESSVPNGTINFSRIRDQVFDGNAQTVWARNYNLLAFQGGIGGLIFNS